MKNIVSFFLFLLLTGAAEARSVRPVEIRDLPAGSARKVNDVDALVHTLFKLRRGGPRSCPLVIRTGKTPRPVLTAAGGKMFLTLPKNGGGPNAPDNRRAVVSALVLSTGTCELHPGAEKALPHWLCAGLFEKAASQKHSERFFRGIAPMPVAAAMYEADKMPELERIPALPPPEGEPASIWYGQFSRLLLEVAVNLKLAPAYAAELLKTSDYEKTSAKFEKDVVSLLNAPLTEKILWTNFSPEPAARKLRLLEKVLQWEMPKVDKDGKFLDAVITCSLTELPRHLADRPDAVEQKQRATQRLLAFRTGCVYGEADDLQQMAYIIGNFSSDPDATSERLGSVLGVLREKLTRRDRLERYLFEIENKSVSASRSRRNGLKLRSAEPAASQEQQRFLLDVENSYSD